MDQDKIETRVVDTTSTEVTAGEEAIIGDGASATVADRGSPEGEAVSPAPGKRTGAARPKRAGKRGGKGEAVSGNGAGSDRGQAKPPRTTARASGGAASEAESKTEAGPASAAAISKVDRLIALLRRPGGATLPELQAATGWQVHSVRGAMAGALRKKSYNMTSEKPDGGLRRYRIEEAS